MSTEQEDLLDQIMEWFDRQPVLIRGIIAGIFWPGLIIGIIAMLALWVFIIVLCFLKFWLLGVVSIIVSIMVIVAAVYVGNELDD